MSTKIFCGNEFSSSMAPNETMLDVSKKHDDGKQVKLSKLIKMFLTSTLMIWMNVKQLELEGVDERLNLQHGEAQHHACFHHGHLCWHP